MNEIMQFEVIGEPQGKGRAKPYRCGNHIRMYTPQKTVVYENLIHMEYEQQCRRYRFPEDSMLEITVEAIFSVPKSVSKKNRLLMLERVLRPVKKPDVDNILKAVCDGLNKVAYADDKQIVSMKVEKFYGETPKIIVSIREVEQCRI